MCRRVLIAVGREEIARAVATGRYVVSGVVLVGSAGGALLVMRFPGG
jgi:hypothetical protein